MKPPWTPAREQRLREFWPKRQFPLRILADEMGITVSSLSQHAKLLGLRSRYAIRTGRLELTGVMAACNFTAGEHEYLAAAANIRNITMRQLVRSILLAVAKDHMIDAILDDKPEHEVLREGVAKTP